MTYGQLNVGDLVKISENGIYRYWLAVHQGNPNTAIYDSSCNGTWLLKVQPVEDVVYGKAFPSSYDPTAALAALQSIVDQRLESAAKSAAKTIKIPYYDGNTDTVKSKSSGYSCKYFILSGIEYGMGQDHELYKEDGARLAYFLEGDSDDAVNKRSFPYYYDNTDSMITRTTTMVKRGGKYSYDDIAAFNKGKFSNASYWKFGAFEQYAMIMNSNATIPSANIVDPNDPPEPCEVAHLDLPTTVYGGVMSLIRCAKFASPGDFANYSTDLNAISEYIWEANSGSGWSECLRIQSPSSLWGTPYGRVGTEYSSSGIQYRVKAITVEGVESLYTTGDSLTVTAPTIKSVNFRAVPTIGAGAILNIVCNFGTNSELYDMEYEIERNLNGSGYKLVYSGAKSFTDTSIDKTWETVQYRVLLTSGDVAITDWVETAISDVIVARTLKYRLHRKNEFGTYDTIHYETSSNIVMRPSGRTVEQDLADYLPEYDSSITPESEPSASRMKTYGHILAGKSDAYIYLPNMSVNRAKPVAKLAKYRDIGRWESGDGSGLSSTLELDVSWRAIILETAANSMEFLDSEGRAVPKYGQTTYLSSSGALSVEKYSLSTAPVTMDRRETRLYLMNFYSTSGSLTMMLIGSLYVADISKVPLSQTFTFNDSVSALRLTVKSGESAPILAGRIIGYMED